MFCICPGDPACVPANMLILLLCGGTGLFPVIFFDI